jgi:hypothetical protein
MDLPTTIAKKRSKNIGGGERASVESFNLVVDISTQGIDDLHYILRQTVGEATAEQIRNDNPPNFILVDGREKPLADVRYKAEIFFGAFLQRALMAAIEQSLHKAILATTTTQSGALSNIRANWQWTLISGGTRQPLGGPQDIKTFAQGDALILSPKIGYAGRVNSLVAKQRGTGFMAAAVDKLRRRTAFRSFQISVGFSKKYMAPNEVMTKKQGTPFIKIKMARAKYRRRTA